jgi:hypothetical protein
MGGAASGAMTGLAAGGPMGAAIGGGLGLLGGKGGGGGKKGGGSKPPDFMALGQPTVNTPWSTQSTTIGPDGRPVTNFGLTGDAGAALTALQGNMLRGAQMDPTKARDQAINQNLDFAMSRLRPEWERQNQSLQASSLNQGLDPGTVAYNAANQELGQRQTDAFGSAYTNALNMGNQTQMTQMAQAAQPFDLYGKLIGSSLQQPNVPGMLPPAAMAYGAQRNQQAGQQGGKDSLMRGLTGLPSALGGKGGKGGAQAPDYFNPGTFGTAGGI